MRLSVLMEMTAHSERLKSNEEESSCLTALTEDGDYVLDSCSERDFDNHGCSKTNKLFSVVIDVWAGRSEFIAWTTFSCSLTEHAHLQQ